MLHVGHILQVAAKFRSAIFFETVAWYAAKVVVDGCGRQPLAIRLVSSYLVVLVEVLDSKRNLLVLVIVSITALTSSAVSHHSSLWRIMSV